MSLTKLEEQKGELCDLICRQYFKTLQILADVHPQTKIRSLLTISCRIDNITTRAAEDLCEILVSLSFNLNRKAMVHICKNGADSFVLQG